MSERWIESFNTRYAHAWCRHTGCFAVSFHRRLLAYENALKKLSDQAGRTV